TVAIPLRHLPNANKPPEGGNQKGGSTPPLELLSCPPLTAAVSRLTAAHSETAEETLRVSAHRSECRQRHSGSGPARRQPLQSEPAPQSERKTTTSLRKTDNRASAHPPRLLPPFAAPNDGEGRAGGCRLFGPRSLALATILPHIRLRRHLAECESPPCRTPVFGCTATPRLYQITPRKVNRSMAQEAGFELAWRVPRFLALPRRTGSRTQGYAPRVPPPRRSCYRI